MTIESLREGGCFEAKLAEGGLPRSLWETYSAFANTDGGVIMLGAREDKGGRLRVVGVNNPEELVKQFWDTVNNESKVNANILLSGDVSVEEVDGKSVVKIRVPRAERFERPIYLNGNILKGSYRRNGEGDYRCPKEEVRAMLRDAEAKSQDSTTVEESDISALDLVALRSYRNRMRLARPGHVWETLPDDMFMFRLGAMARDKSGKLRPTRAGLLMFGFEYEIVREFPMYFLDYQEKFDADTRWTDRIYSSSGDWNGGIYDFYFRVYNRIAQTLKTPFKMIGGERVDDTPVHQAVREALLNCLANADYYQPRGVVVIRDKESLSLSNPGGFRVPIETAMSGGVSDPRNATILKMFSLIDIGERTGSGIPKIRKTCADMHWPDISISEEFNPERTITVLALPYGAAKENPDIAAVKPDIGTPPVTPPVAPPVTPPVDGLVIRLIIALQSGEKGNAELLRAIGIRDRARLRKRYLKGALEKGFVEMTEPDSPHSPNQKYKLTPLGVNLVAEISREGRSPL